MGNYFSNPAYIMPAVILSAVILYFLYGAVDSAGLETQTTVAIVTSKTYTPGSRNYVNRIAGERSWTQAQQQPDFYAISLTVDGEPTVALVSKETFDQLRENDQVTVTVRRTRISGKLEVIDVK
jgi:hypothetical protein